jgi:hypothetical protein
MKLINFNKFEISENDFIEIFKLENRRKRKWLIISHS